MMMFDGLSPDELLALPDDVMNQLILSGRAITFRAGSAEILGRFWAEPPNLVIELGHIDGGGEGVLPALTTIAIRYARSHGLTGIDWRVHAVNCAKPNLKLRALLDRRGFLVVDVPGTGTCYHLVQAVAVSGGE